MSESMTVEHATELAKKFAALARANEDLCKRAIKKCDTLQARVAELEAERDELLSRLPDGMKHCTIVFKECEKGHGWLTATNWVQHGCPTCERDELRRRVDDAESDRTRAANLIAALETELSVYRNECTNVHTNKIKADAVREACDKVVSDYRAVSFDKNDNLYLNIIALRDYAGQIEREGGV